jgi:cation diffusion facilitator CzcD-associated flavoprotein CzcO
MRFAIIGAGMSGVLAAIKLKMTGHADVAVFEKADRIGGTWRENRYPGLACDVPSHAYTYEFAPNPEWSAMFVGGPEIQAYFEKVVDDYGVRPFIRFDSEVAALDWTGEAWRIELADGRLDRADVVIAATGVLHHPNVPHIPGIDTFAGVAMHTAQWDPSVALDGKRIGVIGNGSTGVQMVAHLGLEGHEVTHFQRTPQWIMPAPNRPYTEEEKAVFRSSIEAIDAVRYSPLFLAAVDRFTRGVTDADSAELTEIENICRDFLETSVKDPELREKLRPKYRVACKRLIYSSTYYEAVQRPNVEVVVSGIREVTPEGVLGADGVLHRLEVLALATGFHADRFIRPARVKGLGGVELDEAWEPRCAAYLGIAVPNFPNLFFLNGPTSPVGNFSLIDIAENQWRFIEQLIAKLTAGEAKTVAIGAEAFRGQENARVEAAMKTVWASGCTGYYLDKTGVPISWPWTYDRFREMTKRPDFAAFELQ